MGESPSETVREIEDIRRRIDHELDALGDSLPPKDEVVTRLALGATVGVVAVLGVWLIANRIRARRHDRRIQRVVRDAVQEAQSSPKKVAREAIEAVGETVVDET